MTVILQTFFTVCNNTGDIIEWYGGGSGEEFLAGAEWDGNLAND